MSELELSNGRDEKGRFLPGNPWKLPNWQKGESGRVAKWRHPKAVANACKQYIEERTAEGKPLTWAGLAAYMGITRGSLDAYRKGEVKTAHPSIPNVLDYFKTLMESQLEERLTSKDYSTSGVIFALKNHHQWRDEKHLNVQQEETQTLVINVDPALAAKIQGEVIEGELIDAPQHEDT